MIDPVTDRPVVLVVSGGRTGTTFLGDLLGTVVDDAYSVHEPDLFDLWSRRTWGRIRQFGLYHMVLGRILGRTGIRNLTQRFLSGRLTLQEAVEEIRRHRADYYRSVEGTLVIESYYQWYGLLPAAQRAFPDLRIVVVVRDPRPWVESWLATGTHHGARDLVARFGRRRVNPEMIGDEAYSDRWSTMSPFERNCWDWRTIYGLLHERTRDDPHARIFRYEELFLSRDRAEHFERLLQFITDFSERSFSYQFDRSILDIRKNASREASPAELARSWRRWSSERAASLNEICGDVMETYGYGTEPEWKHLVAKSNR